MLAQMYFSMIECTKHDWHSAQKDVLQHRRDTAGTFIFIREIRVGVLLDFGRSVCFIAFFIRFSRFFSKNTNQFRREVMEIQNGTAVDAAIATLFCNGLISVHSLGMGGGFMMTIYERKNKRIVTIDAKEAAPILTESELYNGNVNKTYIGGLGIAVPGQLKGLYKAKELFGNPQVPI